MSSVRVGVDVGGTFTKAVAADAEQGTVIARSVVATTHEHDHGVAAGVVAAVEAVAGQVGADRVDLVIHSTTQAVNALLEGDVGVVGVIGIGRGPEMRKVAKRTRLGDVELAPGRRLSTVHEVLDVTAGLDRDAAAAAIDRLVAAGATALCVAEAFSPDDDTNERTVAELARARGVPVCTSSELTGLYGLEMRAVTAAINASIIPIALRTADVVEQGVAGVGITSPVMVMRGDGGATALDGFRRAPALTLYSGPAASVAGALRYSGVRSGVVVEVGGTSTNVAAITAGRPALAHVHVASHATAIRALDVRVLGVAGGSMLRVRRRKVYGVGPRSAHIAGLIYACFSRPEDLAGAEAVTCAPRPGDPDDYCVVDARGGRFALTNTCAANVLGIVHEADYARGDAAAARLAFDAVGRFLHLTADEVARRMIEASAGAVGDLVLTVARDHGLDRPAILAVGGGAGGLGRAVAARLGWECTVPPDAEVISSIGDAMSLVRAARERTVADPTAQDIDALVAAVESEAVAAGASPASVEVQVQYVADRKALRAVATGAVGLESGARPGREPLDEVAARRRLVEAGAEGARAVGPYWLGGASSGAAGSTGRSTRGAPSGRVVVLDRFGDEVLTAEGELYGPDELHAAHAAIEKLVRDAVERHTRHVGPMTVPPSAWVIRGARCTEVASGDVANAAGALVASACAHDPEHVAVIIGRS